MHKSYRYFFDTYDAAAEALVTVLDHARKSQDDFEFGSLNLEQVLASGLLVAGEVDALVAKLDRIENATSYED